MPTVPLFHKELDKLPLNFILKLEQTRRGTQCLHREAGAQVVVPRVHCSLIPEGPKGRDRASVHGPMDGWTNAGHTHHGVSSPSAEEGSPDTCHTCPLRGSERMNLENIMLQRISQTPEDKYCESSYMSYGEQDNSEAEGRMGCQRPGRGWGMGVQWEQSFIWGG